jgi:hypothetical protein
VIRYDREIINTETGVKSFNKFINKLTALISDLSNKNFVISNISLTNNFNGFFNIKVFKYGRFEIYYFRVSVNHNYNIVVAL